MSLRATSFTIKTALLVSAAAILAAAGCASPRERMQATRRPRNTLLEPAKLAQEVPLTDPKGASFLLWDRSQTQSLHLLQLGRDAVLDERYHERHDLTLLCVSGSAIVEVEKERHFVRPPAAVLVPRLYAYKIIPNDPENEFVALAVYSPPFDGKDCRLVTK